MDFVGVDFIRRVLRMEFWHWKNTDSSVVSLVSRGDFSVVIHGITVELIFLERKTKVLAT
jgi:hypothetical protein